MDFEAVDHDPFDMSNKYNTPLSLQDEMKFQQWARQNPQLGSTYDYDARGYWKSGAQQDSSTGHGTDQFKKPNHPTFSNQSQYHGVDGYQGGVWGNQSNGASSFVPSSTNLQMHGMQGLQDYFNKVEQGNKLVIQSPVQPISMMRMDNAALPPLYDKIYPVPPNVEPHDNALVQQLPLPPDKNTYMPDDIANSRSSLKSQDI